MTIDDSKSAGSRSNEKHAVGWWMLLVIIVAGGIGFMWRQASLAPHGTTALDTAFMKTDVILIEPGSSSRTDENTPNAASILTRRITLPVALTTETHPPAPDPARERSALAVSSMEETSADSSETAAVVPGPGVTDPSEPGLRTPDPAATEPQTARNHFELARSAQDQGRDSQAIYHYRQAILIDPRLAEAYLNLGNLFYFRQRTPEKAMEMYKQVLSLDPTNELAHNNLGVIFLQRNMLGQAETAFQAAIDRNPDYVDALYNMACLSARQSKGDQAMDYLKRAAKLKPEAAVWAAEDNDLKNLRRRKDFNRFLSGDTS
jgi:tetratricopeptide (TPR) repeat protein